MNEVLMSAVRPITIVGGGLAGLTLGIGLRQRGAPVTVWEAGQYPRHRVCGEFISGRGQETLGRLGLRELLFRAGARPAETAAFFTPTSATPAQRLPGPGWCLSRHTLDHLLAQEFRRLGGQLQEQERWREDASRPGVVRASGRRAQPVVSGWRWFGFKAHARHVPLVADLELHLSPHGYTGLCRLGDQQVNVCGLFRRSTTALAAVPPWPDQLRGAEGSLLRARLADAVFEPDSFCSVAGLMLKARRASERSDCCVGDAVTMIPPITGNGMSMAFESAELAVEPLAAYSRGEISWAEARQTIARQCDEAFSQRLGWATWMQRVLFAPGGQSALGWLAQRCSWLWPMLFAKTR